jgi:hypothetical protein
MMDRTEVQNKLNSIGYHKEFTVIFTKTNGEQRKITGFMEEPTGTPKKDAVPVKVTEGDAAGQWRSFRLDSVLEILT